METSEGKIRHIPLEEGSFLALARKQTSCSYAAIQSMLNFQRIGILVPPHMHTYVYVPKKFL